MESRAIRPKDVPECQRFLDLFRQHFEAGTRIAEALGLPKTVSEVWTDSTFAKAMRSSDSRCNISTVRDWRSGERWPQCENKDLILKVFFRSQGGTYDEEAKACRGAMDQAWADGQKALAAARKAVPPVASPAPSAGPSSPVSPKPPNSAVPDEVESAGFWVYADKVAGIDDMVSIGLDEPLALNQKPMAWRIGARIRFGIARRRRKNGDFVYIGLGSPPRLRVSVSSGLRVVPKSMVGDADRAPHDNFVDTPNLNDAEIVGPRQDGEAAGCLKGDPLAGHHICQIVEKQEGGREGEHVTLSIVVERGGFTASRSAKPRQGDAAELVGCAKERVVGALLDRLFASRRNPKEDPSAIEVARDSMVRKKSA